MFGEEGIETAKMGFSFLLFAALLIFVVRNVYIGNTTANQAIEKLDKSEDQETFLSFNELTGEGVEVPMAAAYAFVNYNENSISSITCKIEISEGEGRKFENLEDSCLKTHLTGECVLSAEYNNSYGGYDVIISGTRE